jgi:hypothetical protein
LMLDEAQQRDTDDISLAGLKRIADWDVIFAAAGFTQAQIRSIRASGFSAAIYENQRTGEITIVFDGALVARHEPADAFARLAEVDVRYRSAALLAWRVRQTWIQSTVSMTGYASDGDLAAYAAEQIGGAPVVAFNSSIKPAFVRGTNRRLVKIDWVSR